MASGVKIMSKLMVFVKAALVMMFASSMAFAIPGTPHNFFGSVTINGAPAPDGTVVSAHLDGAEVATTATSGGNYGILPAEVPFYIEDPENDRSGKAITFYVNGVAAATAVFANGASNQLDLGITVSTPPANNNDDSNGGGGSRRRTTTVVPPTNTEPDGGNNETNGTTPTEPETCTEQWTCSEWGPCIEGVQARTCEDVNSCGTDEDKPLFSQPCSTINQTPPLTAFLVADPAITGGLVVIILVILYLLWKTFSKGKKGAKKSKKK